MFWGFEADLPLVILAQNLFLKAIGKYKCDEWHGLPNKRCRLIVNPIGKIVSLTRGRAK